MCGKDAGRGEGPNGTPSGGCPVGLPVEGSGGVSEKSFETRGCLIRCAVDAGSDGTRIGFEGTHVIVDLDENIAEVVQVRHQHVRIHRPTNPARPRSVWSDSNKKLKKGCRDCSGTLGLFVREGTPGGGHSERRTRDVHARSSGASIDLISISRPSRRESYARRSRRHPPKGPVIDEGTPVAGYTLLAARVWTTTDRYVRYARLDEQPGWNRVAR